MLTDSIIKDIRHQLRYGGILIKLIFINAVVFLAFAILYFIEHFTKSQVLFQWLAAQFELSSSFSVLVRKPWTLITHMFTHFQPGHILGNMLFLYFFGQVFILYMKENRVLPLYIFSGLVGAILALLGINFIPAIRELGLRPMVGASAAVLGIIFAAVAVNPEHKVRVFFLGEIKLMYLAIVPLIIDILSIPYGNAGGYIAHLGGAVAGYNYIKLLQNGIDLFAPIEKLKTIFSNKSKMKVAYKNTDVAKSHSPAKTNDEQKRVDEILDKIGKSGYDSLTKEEKDFLFHYSNK